MRLTVVSLVRVRSMSPFHDPYPFARELSTDIAS